METYISLINGIENILNHKGRNKKDFPEQQNFLLLLSELKQNYKIELSKKFLFNLFKAEIPIKRRKLKIKVLFKGLEVQKHFNYKRILDFMKYRTEIKTYGLNKWNKPVLKNLRVQNIGKEFINTQKEILTFPKL